MVIEVDDSYLVRRGIFTGAYLKWHKDNYWIKADSTCYEGLAEDLAYKVSECIDNVTVQPYHSCEIYDNTDEIKMPGCYCEFLQDKCISVVALMREVGSSLFVRYNKLEPSEKLDFILDYLHLKTKLDLEEYICLTLLFDALISNQDRYLSNIHVLYSSHERRYLTSPLLDNGFSFGLNIINSKDKSVTLDNLVSQPFSDSFDEQISLAVSRGYNLSIDKDKLESLIEGYSNSLYDQKVVAYAKDVLKKNYRKLKGYGAC